MNQSNRLSDAVGNIGDRFIIEAFTYQDRSKRHKAVRTICAAAAGICLIIGMAMLVHKNESFSITVYAYEADQELTNGKTVLTSGIIEDNGQMKGAPLTFYVLGSGIESIRFSCKNEWISFVDLTEQREDYGLSKNFTVLYGEQEDDYYYLMVDWTPQNIIRKLTDNSTINISGLTQEEKEDIIVMEVTYMDGRTESAAVWISLESNGEFSASVGSYEISDNDEFIFQPDSSPIKREYYFTECTESTILDEDTKAAGQLPDKELDKELDEEQDEKTKEHVTINNSLENALLSEEELAHVRQVIAEYYVSIHRKMIDFVQTDDPSAVRQEHYGGYEPSETVIFEVSVENSEAKRYIVIGSKDHWNHCTVLNEGY